MRVRLLAIALAVVVGAGLAIAWRTPTGKTRFLGLHDRIFVGAVPGEGAPPLEAVFNDPSGLWVDRSGTVFFSERRSHVVRSLAGGKVTTIAGNGRRGHSGDGVPARRARLSYPEGLTGDAQGNVYVADSGNHRIRRIAPDGTIATVAGTGEAGFSGDGGPAARARLYRPMDVCLGPSGALYVSDWGNHRIRRVSRDGMITTVAGNGEAGFSGDGGAATEAALNEPYGIWVDPEERLVIADSSNHRVRRVSVDGMISTIAGVGVAGFSGDGGLALDARFDSPQAVFVNASGEILVNDEHNHRIRSIGPDGVLRPFAGNGRDDLCGDGGPATEACLNDPEAIMASPAGNLFLTDGDNHRIRRIDASGVIETIAGSGPIGKRRAAAPDR